MTLTLALVLAALLADSPPDAPVEAPAAVVAQAPAESVAFTRLSMPDAAGPAVEIGVWRPAGVAANVRLPLVVMSHGNGGDFRSHEDTARALAGAGFIVAALTHTGDNWRDQSQATDMAQRPRQLHVLIDYMTGEWDGRASVDPGRIGVFGFSSGAFTVLAAAGGEPDLSRVTEHCQAHPGFYACRLVASRGAPAAQQVWTHDARIKAVVAAAPALGFTFTPEGLAGVTQPVQLWRAEIDQILPSPFYAEVVRDALPKPPEYHLATGANHFDFLPPCSAQLAASAPMICVATPGLDRKAFHETFNREVVRFFREKL